MVSRTISSESKITFDKNSVTQNKNIEDLEVEINSYNEENPFSEEGNGVQNRIWFNVFLSFFFMALVLLLFLNKFAMSRDSASTPVLNLDIEGLVLTQSPKLLAMNPLVDKHGAVVTADIWQGQWDLLFFGFTHCPHICPTTLAELNRANNNLPNTIQSQVNVHFVSVDPKRDTPERINTYLDQFNPNFYGLTGDFIDLKIFADNVFVPFLKSPQDVGEPDSNVYNIDHGGQVIVVDPEGRYVGYFQTPIKSHIIEESLPKLIAAYR